MDIFAQQYGNRYDTRATRAGINRVMSKLQNHTPRRPCGSTK